MFESLPQLILNLEAMMIFDVIDTINISSAVFSCISLYGYASSFPSHKFDIVDPPVAKVVWSILAIIIDVIFCISLSVYMFLTLKYYAFLMPAAFLIPMIIAVWSHKKMTSVSYGSFFGDIIMNTVMAMITSLHWDVVGYPYRLLSKLFFNGLATIFLSYELAIHHPNVTFESHLGDICNNMCSLNATIIDKCNEYDETKFLAKESYIQYMVLLWSLLVLSTLEGILEKYFPWMPRNKFLEPIKSEEATPDIEMC